MCRQPLLQKLAPHRRTLYRIIYDRFHQRRGRNAEPAGSLESSTKPMDTTPKTAKNNNTRTNASTDIPIIAARRTSFKCS